MKSSFGCFTWQTIQTDELPAWPRPSFEEQKFVRSQNPSEPLPSWSALSAEDKVVEVAMMVNQEITAFMSNIESPPSLQDLQADFTSLSSLPPLLQLLLVKMTWNVNQEKQDLKKKKVLTIGHMIMKVRDLQKTNSFMLVSSLALYSMSGSWYILDLLDSVGFGISNVCAKKYL